MSSGAVIAILYAIIGVICWGRFAVLLAWHEKLAWHERPDGGIWAFGILMGFLGAIVWPGVLLVLGIRSQTLRPMWQSVGTQLQRFPLFKPPAEFRTEPELEPRKASWSARMRATMKSRTK